MKGPAGGTCSSTRGSRAAVTLQVVAMCTLTAETGASLLREARLGLDHHHADVEQRTSAARAVRAAGHGLSSST